MIRLGQQATASPASHAARVPHHRWATDPTATAVIVPRTAWTMAIVSGTDGAGRWTWTHVSTPTKYG